MDKEKNEKTKNMKKLEGSLKKGILYLLLNVYLL